MRIRIEVADELQEPEIIIRTPSLNDKIQKLSELISKTMNENENISFFKEDTAYYLDLKEILFFETDEKDICAHTINEVYHTKYKLYELEEILPHEFMRISKSAIVNTKKIYAMTYSLRSCVIDFKDTHKQVYVSRYYYKPLKDRLEKR